ncbi:Pls/PosA family non-ribosomal peptide synthetase [Sanguibacter suarezii]|uniref:Pls/PosA family non-ribosomal peptide synthetase n=1 Tax=Sanguibacter suarezii TaxID=60921 RepID=UPI000A4F3F80|nr:Pls/PosA family non-ribosomal peptide synthetase [Sanguibacter suarezii]
MNTAGDPVPPPRVPAALLRSGDAPPPRTLVDVFHQSVEDFPDAPALDNGAQVLTYAELADAAYALAGELAGAGVGGGDRVGVRIASGTTDLYVAIIAVLVAGAAYVPVDADDPDERARTVFAEADVAAVIGNDLAVAVRRPVAVGASAAPLSPVLPSPASSDAADGPALTDDAWIIFTSGSTGTPKGVAVSHRSAAAFVDAEAHLFLQDAPLGPGDRVMAGLSVAFDASCEEMWLAWRHGGCLVPAPRSLVRSGMDLGPWMIANDITVVSTVPTLVALWPPGALDAVRLVILGGEACPPEIGARLATADRELWNTYGPTEATVVACAARLTAEPPVRIGLPLAGWDLAVVDPSGEPVPTGSPGELIIGGVGLARYLDPVKDAEKYAPMPTLGWDRAYRSGDMVTFDGTGLVFAGRVDDQVKIGGRRVELGEVDSALLALPGVEGAAAAIRTTGSGNTILVGYVTTTPEFSASTAMTQLRASMPAALVPRLAQVDTLPTRTSGKIDRDALPWPLPAARSAHASSDAPSDASSGARSRAGSARSGRTPAQDAPGAPTATPASPTESWLQELWLEILGAVVTSGEDDFFALGGGSLTAAQLVSRLRARFPEVTVADVYEHPTAAALAATLDAMAVPTGRRNTEVRPVPRRTQAGQVVFSLALRTIGGLRWLVWLAAASTAVASLWDVAWLPRASSWAIAAGWAVLVLPHGRMVLAALGARALLAGVGPGEYPRGGQVHLRLWLAERLVDELGATTLSGAAWMPFYARALGATVGPDVDLHTIPPVTGLLTLGAGCSIEPEVDLVAHWIDGDVLHIGAVWVGDDARVGARSTLGAGARVGARAEIAPGSAVLGTVPDDEFWSGAPAQRAGAARGPWRTARPPRRPRWLWAYAAMSALIAALPVVAVVGAGALVVDQVVDAGSRASQGGATSAGSVGAAAARALLLLPLGTVVAVVVLAVSIWALVRALSVGLTSGIHPVQGLRAWQAWSILRVLDEARTWLFPLYSSSLTPAWLRALGAQVGRDTEASTVLLIPCLTSVNDGAFLADDTMLGMYELGNGWLRIETVKIGKHAFVGNSGMTAAGRKVPKGGLVAVLSAAPRRTKAKSGTSWLGSPPTRLRRVVAQPDQSRTYAPPTRLRVARALIEVCRLVPVMVHAATCLGVVTVLLLVAGSGQEWAGWPGAALVCGALLLVVGALAAAVTTAAKWALVGRVRLTDHPLWSSFVWRNELADTFVEVLAAPFFARIAVGTPVLNVWLRSVGARIGRGVWCETYWLPEADLVELRDGATVNQGCVVQTHLFHDRTLSLDTVVLREGATLGPNSVILPAASLGRHATVGPVSLVMRGESVPDKTRWIGNPIGPWVEDEAAGARPAPTEGRA